MTTKNLLSKLQEAINTKKKFHNLIYFWKRRFLSFGIVCLKGVFIPVSETLAGNQTRKDNVTFTNKRKEYFGTGCPGIFNTLKQLQLILYRWTHFLQFLL
jgi:hypothetical protein